MENTNQRAEFSLSYELTSILDLDLSLVWDRVGNPKPDAAGVVPGEDDVRMIVGIGLDFD